MFSGEVNCYYYFFTVMFALQGGRAIIFVMSLQGDFDELEICSGGVNVREVRRSSTICVKELLFVLKVFT